MRPQGPSQESLDRAQVELSPDQSQEVLAMGEVVSVASLVSRGQLYCRSNPHVLRPKVQSSLVVVDLHQHFKAGPDLQEHQTVGHAYYHI